VAILAEDMKRLVREQDSASTRPCVRMGRPTYRRREPTRVWDDDHLFFADIRSPQTVANIRRGSLVEIKWSIRSCARVTVSKGRP
jgi:hypothetical protein